MNLYGLGAEGLVREEGLGHERFEFNPEVLCWTGKRSGKVYALGDHLQVRIDRIDLLRRECDLSLAKLALDMPQGRRRGSGSSRGKSRSGTQRNRGRRQKK